MIREIEYPGVSSTRTFTETRAHSTFGERHRGHIGVIEGALVHADNSKSTTAIRIGAGDEGVGGHPVVRMSLALLGREERQQGRQGIKREGLARRQREVLASQLEGITNLVIADHGPAIRLFDLNAKVEQTK